MHASASSKSPLQGRSGRRRRTSVLHWGQRALPSANSHSSRALGGGRDSSQARPGRPPSASGFGNHARQPTRPGVRGGRGVVCGFCPSRRMARTQAGGPTTRSGCQARGCGVLHRTRLRWHPTCMRERHALQHGRQTPPRRQAPKRWDQPLGQRRGCNARFERSPACLSRRP